MTWQKRAISPIKAVLVLTFGFRLAFFESLKSFSPFDYDLPEGADVHMIHGARDTVVDFGQALKYSLRKKCR